MQLAENERRIESLMDEGRFRLLVDAITDYAIFMLSPEGLVTSWNAGAQRYKGYQAHEILGEHFSRFYPEEDRKAGLPERALATALSEGRFDNEGWRVRKDGSRFWAHVIIDPVRTSTGELIGFAKVTRDLTERKQAEAELKRSEQQFRILVQGVTDYAIYMLDPDGLVSNWNAGAQRIKGYMPEEILGQHFSRFYTDEDRARGEPQRSLETARREGRFESEGWRQRKDGTRFWASVVVDAIRDERGELLGFAKVTRDISEKRQAQQALERAREELFQSQKMEALGQLTGGIAHDFNNLLMAVLGSLEIVRRRLPEDSPIAPLIANAVQGAQRGAALTQRLLAFSRRQTLQMDAIEVPALIAGMTDLLQRSLGATAFLETRFPPDLPSVMTDYNQLETAILNLVVNARDAMLSGGLISITAYEETVSPGQAAVLRPGRYVCISVKDEGEGMDAETLAQAAAPFFTTKGVGKGTGLGLSMVQGLVEQSGGGLVLRSGKGKGTTVELWLPVATDGAKLASAEKSAPSKSAAHEQRSLRILVVDDDSLVLKNTTLMLVDLGHSVLEAEGGEEALDILRHQRVDLVVSDHAMPRMTGSQLAEIIRGEWPQLPIILVTGYAELPAGSSPDLPRLGKPFSQEQLAETIGNLMI
ncbi:PAS domain-containing sensor histidine kinase [Rhizobium sp. BK251]|uniref:hybrid sensor histidine kinase/response regulator n=1 Tax=Rhizobium sp. BK251 TaxID=2512125 RepID=UPI001044CFFA|nr:PAS domain-containing sensor histidine kinase [Rhizobium sp. BK251]TCL68361.1 PAS domain S-box-containing protein [Rhizobium sp. BK251]